MELFQLVYAEMLAKYCNFSKAAEKLFITQPALSQQIQKLEQEIGFSLFTRTSKNVSLTLAGQEFLNRAHEVTAAYDRLNKTVQSLSCSMSNELVFGSSPLSAPHISDGLSAFFATYPMVKFRYIETWDPDLLELVRQGEIDVALLCLPHGQNKLDNITIWPIQDEYVCILVDKHHRLAGRESVSLEDLVQEHLIFTSPHSGLRALMVEIFKRSGIALSNNNIDLISLEARLSLVRSGAITFVMNEQFRLYKTNEFAVIPIVPKIYRTFALISTKELSESFVVRAFIDTTLQRIHTHLKDPAEKVPNK